MKTEAGTSAPTGAEGRGPNPATRASRHAAEYLWLRLHALLQLYPEQRAAFSWPPLEECFDRLKTLGQLTDSDVDRVLRIEAKAPPRLRLENLLDVYAAAGQLQRRLQSQTLSQAGKEFYESLFTQLGRKLRLTRAQVRRADLDLQDGAFAWARGESL